MRRAAIIGWGDYTPPAVLSNDDLASVIDTNDEWIRSRTGIERRHFAAEGQTTSDMAARAAQAALKMAGLQPDDIDALIVATSTADLTFPSAATMVQERLGMTRGFAFDVQAVCAGFVYALAQANALIVSGQANRALVIGAETFSRILDWEDRTTCVLFGDGAGAAILGPSSSMIAAACGQSSTMSPSASWQPTSTPMAATAIFFTSMAAFPPRIPDTFECRARRSSATPSKSWPKLPIPPLKN